MSDEGEPIKPTKPIDPEKKDGAESVEPTNGEPRPESTTTTTTTTSGGGRMITQLGRKIRNYVN
jgi:hypothetical protein